MSKFKVAMVANDLPPTPDWVVERLTEQGIELVEFACAAPREVVDFAAVADVIWSMGGSRVITAEILPRLHNCRMILRTGTGTDDIPVEEATRLGILVANTPEVTSAPGRRARHRPFLGGDPPNCPARCARQAAGSGTATKPGPTGISSARRSAWPDSDASPAWSPGSYRALK